MVSRTPGLAFLTTPGDATLLSQHLGCSRVNVGDCFGKKQHSRALARLRVRVEYVICLAIDSTDLQLHAPHPLRAHLTAGKHLYEVQRFTQGLRGKGEIQKLASLSSVSHNLTRSPISAHEGKSIRDFETFFADYF